MITNFEEITEELSQEERKVMLDLIVLLRQRSSTNPIKAPAIVRTININLAPGFRRITEVRLRKMVNFIRSRSMLPVIATSSGYYVSNDPEEIRAQIKSLQERANSINECADGLCYFLNPKASTGVQTQLF